MTTREKSRVQPAVRELSFIVSVLEEIVEED
jgi:hypothetical protein